MKTSPLAILIGGAAALLAVCWAFPAQGQSRRDITISRVGMAGEVLGETLSDRFNRYSYGLGNLPPGSSGPRSNILESSMGIRPGYSVNISRPLLPSYGGPGPTELQGPSSVKVYNPELLFGAPPPAASIGPVRAIPQDPTAAFDVSEVYFFSIANTPLGTPVLGMDQPREVSSFVPTYPGEYQTWMKEGDEAFRRGDFQRAYDRFRLAYDVAGKHPESLLSLTHAGVALATHSYAEPAVYLRRALKYLPELPLAPLRPKAFFGDSPDGQQRYTECVERLAAHLGQEPYDLNAQLLIAYFRWFAGDAAAAEQALTQAATEAQRRNDEDTLEAADIFWKGMLSSGAVSGSLPGIPPESDATATSPEEKPAEDAGN